MKRHIITLALIVLTAVTVSAEQVNLPDAENNADTSAVSFTADTAMKFFQVFISPIDNRRCIFSPTCSVYARRAIAKYGFIKAYPLIAARLIRCNPSAWLSQVYEEAEEGRGGPCYDPVP
jgi:hypothetical protein